MKAIKYKTFLLLLVIVCSVCGFAQIYPVQRDKIQIEVVKEKFHIYILAGQSNMAGRGIVEPQDTVENVRILTLNREGDWEIAKDPIHYDKVGAGVGPGLSFAREMLKNEDKDVVIGLIPCAAGGSSVSVWLNDEYWSQTRTFPYNNMLLRTKLALKDGSLKGVLWHQGESDASQENAIHYKERLTLLIHNLRTNFGMPNLVFIAGELPETCSENAQFNELLVQLKEGIPFYDVVSGCALTTLSDNVHLDAVSARKLGKRYADKMRKTK